LIRVASKSNPKGENLGKEEGVKRGETKSWCTQSRQQGKEKNYGGLGTHRSQDTKPEKLFWTVKYKDGAKPMVPTKDP